MVTVAIIAVLSAIAVPLYNGYIRESHFATMRSNLDRLRTDIEDYRLENGTYGNIGSSAAVNAVLAELNAQAYTYAIVSPTTNTYDVTGALNAKVWVRCDNRFTNCCDPDTPSATAVGNACP